MVDEDQKNWDVKIETVLMGYRASRQASTKYSPYFLLFQKEMRLPIDNEIMQNEESHNHMESEMSIVIEALLQTKEKLYEATGLNISLAQREQKELYDSKHNPNELQVGTTVLKENTRQKQRKGGKMDDRWFGPYSINRCIGKGVYELKNMKGAVLKIKVNVYRLKVYKYLDEHKESNEDMDAKNEKNEGTDAKSEGGSDEENGKEGAANEENEGADANHEEKGGEGGSNEENGNECASNDKNRKEGASNKENE